MGWGGSLTPSPTSQQVPGQNEQDGIQFQQRGAEVDREDENKYSVRHTPYKFSVLGGRDGSAVRGYAHEQNQLTGSRLFTTFSEHWDEMDFVLLQKNHP